MDRDIWTIGLVSTLGITLTSVLAYHFYRKLNKKRLKGKVVVITGASSGIGKALAEELYKKGCKVVLISRNRPALEQVKSDMLNMHIDETEEPVCFPLDVTDLDALPSKIRELLSIVENVDILVNNAGISQRSNFVDTTFDVDRKIFDVNFLGPVYMTKLLLPQMISRKEGTIVNNCSLQSIIALPARSMYSSSKFALRAFSNSLRIELKDFNVDVLVVNPGYVSTNISRNALTGTGELAGLTDTHKSALSCNYVAKKIVDAIEMKRTQIELYDSLLSRLGTMMYPIMPCIINGYLYKKYKKEKKHSD